MNFLKKYYAVLTGIFVFIIYLTTLAPSVVEIDSGELSTVQATLGIAHPTGYPLFTILGHIFYIIPLPFSKIYQLNLLTAIWCSLAIMVFVSVSKLVLDNTKIFVPVKFYSRNKPQTKGKKITEAVKPGKNKLEIPEIKKYLGAVFGGLILAFDKTFWMQGTSVEVYSLQLLLFSLIIFFLVKAYIFQDVQGKIKFFNPWMTFAFFLALGFTNHMTTLYIIPGAAYLFFDKYGFNKNSLRRIFNMFAIFIPVLILLYAYLPLRAMQNPILDWGNPDNYTRFMRHIGGDQYHVWLFSSTAAAVKQLSYFISNLPGEFLTSLFISIIGLLYAYKVAKKFFIFALITFLFSLLYSINYDIHDIDSYFLLTYVSISFFAVFGAVQLLSMLKHSRHPYATPAILISIFILVQIYFNYAEDNQSDVFTFEDYTKTVLHYCSKNSILFSYEWDYLVSPSLYFQYVENYRPDVTVVDKELLRRSWYYYQLNNDHPYLLTGLQPVVKGFLNAVAPFESGGRFDPNSLEYYYRKIMTDLVASNINKRDFYIAPELFDNEMQRGEFSLPKGYTLVPDVLMFKAVKGNNYIPAGNPNFTIRFPKVKTIYTNFIEQNIGSMLARRALYEMQFDKIDRAKIYIRKIKKDFPDYTLPQGLGEVLEK